ncbi:elongin C [Saccharomycopsis crataegensis]|uniref:Elongin-C n=1 Tax=Saccharomycopsis crataegensis TaxID=43959 RepID=A0AAV5QWF7_9ASCO|nr:elongin C [Saccharomycopsis crataegensis]
MSDLGSDIEQDSKPRSKYVKLVSSDGFEFIILRELAEISPTLASMLDESFEFKESKLNKIVLREMDSFLLEKVVDYLYYHKKFSDKDDVPDFEIPTEMALELLVAADFLNI